MRSNKIIKEKIKSVRRWLDKAESSYDQELEAKGELNLILAKAEMQHLEEKNKPFIKGFTLLGIPFVFFSLAIVAIIIFTNNKETNFQYYEKQEISNVIELDSGLSRDVKWLNNIELQYPSESKVETNRTVTLQKNQFEESENNYLSQQEKQNVMDTKDIRKAVQDAGKSLRGK